MVNSEGFRLLKIKVIQTHAEKSHAAKSQVPPTVVPKPQSTAPMAVAFDDQRPELAVQLKMQEMADASVQVFQLRAYQEMADVSPQVQQLKKVQLMANEQVIQLELDKNSLNVVGEDHDISGGERRVIEKAYSEEFTGGGYWKENEFKIESDDEEFSADPTAQRFLTELQKIYRLSGDFSRAYSFGLASSIVNRANDRLSKLTPLILLVERLWTETSDPQYPNSLTAEDIEISRIRHAGLQTFRQSLTVLSSMKGQRLNATRRATIKMHYERILNARRVMVENVAPEADLNRSRSKAMHQAAQSNSMTKGVWKIGESHVDDILNNLNLIYPRLYNLVTQDEFEDDLLADPQLKNIAENPTPAEARDRGLYGKEK